MILYKIIQQIIMWIIVLFSIEVINCKAKWLIGK